jgi:hypothetical protein
MLTFTDTFFPAHTEKIKPVSIDTKLTKSPTDITRPISAPSIAHAAKGPLAGGTSVWVAYRPRLKAVEVKAID